MKIIIGLGNPGARYEGTRHNIGFAVIDRLAEAHAIRVNTARHRALCGTGIIEGEKVLLVKPQTYMNLSGESVRAALDYYKLPLSELLVIYDDVSMPLGQLRIRLKGSAGGHNGIKSIIAHLGGMDFPRIKCGVGAAGPQTDLADHVLGHFDARDAQTVREEVARAARAAEVILRQGPAAAMNLFNAAPAPEKTEE